MTITAVKITCICDFRYIGFLQHWVMFNCPNCGKSGIDIEETYTRYSGIIKEQEWFLPPYFEEEDEYHSALLSWLNDSDEKYKLSKPDNVLLIQRG